ncbi:dUTP diphosphatase [Candidatus Pacearchaeota archaeon]|nr:dUTP diphosphatase [Candidatus Pacearchaeota archaeon]
MPTLKFKKLREDAVIPSYAHPGDAGMDLCSAEDFILEPKKRKLISTGLSVEIPVGYEIQTRPRSGLAIKNGISLVNSPGTIDAGYRGEIGIIIINHGEENFEIKKGDRIAQAVMNKIENAEIIEVDKLGDSERGAGGFGSTGK